MRITGVDQVLVVEAGGPHLSDATSVEAAPGARAARLPGFPSRPEG
jgi:hypothetical protein